MTRGRAPVASRIASASIRSLPPEARCATTAPGPSRRPRPARSRTPERTQRRAVSSLCAVASALMRVFTAARSTATAPAAPVIPRASLARTCVADSATASSALLGTQSVSTAEPPIPSESISVTCAPIWAATRAASYPPGPPPTITTEVMAPIIAHGPRAARRGRQGARHDRISATHASDREDPCPSNRPLPAVMLPVQARTPSGDLVRIRWIADGEHRPDSSSEYDDWGAFDIHFEEDEHGRAMVELRPRDGADEPWVAVGDMSWHSELHGPNLGSRAISIGVALHAAPGGVGSVPSRSRCWPVPCIGRASTGSRPPRTWRTSPSSARWSAPGTSGRAWRGGLRSGPTAATTSPSTRACPASRPSPPTDPGRSGRPSRGAGAPLLCATWSSTRRTGRTSIPGRCSNGRRTPPFTAQAG